MFQGTGSDVGKSMIVAGLARAFTNRGLKVRPFKPQNMSNNAAVTADGGEIGRAQALQARAARVASSVHMNPVLLKPQSDVGSQVIVQGRIFGNAKAADYHRLKPQLLHSVLDSYRHLADEADLVLVEGAGSPAEINLRAGDIANMGFAEAADIPVVLVGDSLLEADLITVGGGLFDPHVWFDARLWSRGAAPVAEALAAADPAHADAHRGRAAAYVARLVALDERLRTQIATIPASRRVLVTAHDAFRYFGRAYGIEVVGVQGTSTESEAGLADINRLVDLVVSRSIPAVFIETSVSDRSVAAIREGARARGHDVGVGGTLYSDSLGGPGSGAETLETALETNMAAIVAALRDTPTTSSGSAP